MSDMHQWYQSLKKPSWAPPKWLFTPVWTVLYGIVAVSFGAVIYQALKGELLWPIAIIFVFNLILNFLFTWLQFKLRNNILAAIDIILISITLVLAMISIWPYQRWVAYANIPYLIWISFATVLQLAITKMNLSQ